IAAIEIASQKTLAMTACGSGFECTRLISDQYICYLPSAICHLLFAICYLLSAICHLLFAICYLPSATRRRL
ncbi:MAG: hypothetical protein CVU38_12770, partial [Chloroflexi bacterium HGW-Chloroflexi-1]